MSMSARRMLGVLALVPLGLPVSARAVTDLGLSPFQAQTAWVSPHRDMQNTDFVPYATATHLQVAWHVETGNATLWAPAIAPDGNLYLTTGRQGDPTLHAYDRAGVLSWESGIPVAGSDPNPVAVAELPFVDLDGDLYLSDNAFFWAFHADGTLKWKTAFPVHPDGAQSFIGAPVLTSSGAIGGVTNRGQVLFYDRATGAQAIPAFDLPGGPAPAGTATPGGLWGGGEMDPAFRDVFWAGLNGFELEVSNTPAMQRDVDRLFITATSSTSGSVGALYALDLVAGQWQIAFETPLGVNSGTSPALSPDGTQIYAVGGDSELAAYDATTGQLLWTVADVNGTASPQVGPDGTVYSGTTLGDEVVALHPDGTIKWRRNYDQLAVELLPHVSFFGSILVNGNPVARGDSVGTITGNHIKVVMKLGYDFLPPGGVVNTLPKMLVLATLCPLDGQILAWVPLPDDSRGLISVAEDGRIYTSHAAAFTSIFYYFANAFVPAAAQVTGPPAGGVTALEPVAFVEQTTAGLVWARQLAEAARGALVEGAAAAAHTAARRADVQLAASADSFLDAEAHGEITAAAAATRSADAFAARSQTTIAKNALAGGSPTPGDVATADAALAAAVTSIAAALAGLPCDDGAVCTAGDQFTAGACPPGTVAAPLTTAKLKVKLTGAAASAEKDQIQLATTFPLAALPTNATTTGLTFTVANGDGKTFFSGTIPAASFVDKKGDGIKVTFADKDGTMPSANGIRKLDVKKNVKKGTVQVKAKVQGAETIGADGHTEMKVSLLFGSDPLVDACPGAAALPCTVKPGKLTSCALPTISVPYIQP